MIIWVKIVGRENRREKGKEERRILVPIKLSWKGITIKNTINMILGKRRTRSAYFHL